jgi:hypothetical protein
MDKKQKNINKIEKRLGNSRTDGDPAQSGCLTRALS